MNFIFIAEVFVHMLFKSGLLSQTDYGLNNCRIMVKFLTLNSIIRSLVQATELEESL